jgi:hypothetical protein
MAWINLEQDLKEEFETLQLRELDKIPERVSPTRIYYYRHRDIIRARRIQRYHNEDLETKRHNLELQRKRRSKMNPVDRAKDHGRVWKAPRVKQTKEERREKDRVAQKARYHLLSWEQKKALNARKKSKYNRDV